MSPRELRLERNENLFREVNERIVALAGTRTVAHLELICECANTGCADVIEVPLAEYAPVRDSADWFLIALGHGT